MSHAAPTTPARDSGLTTPIGVALHALVRPLVEKLDQLPSVLGTVFEEQNPPWCEEPFLKCKTYLDKRQLELDRIEYEIKGQILHEASRMLRAAGFDPSLHAGSQCWYEWNVFNHGQYEVA